MAAVLVCCVDDSEHAPDVARVAARVGEALGLRLLLLHVARAPTAPGVSAARAGQERLVESEREHGSDLLDGAARAAGLTAEIERRIEFGSPAERTLAVCSETGAEVVVLGSRGRGGIKRAVLGSVSHEVASKAACVVVIVPPGVTA
ncbi:MAG TPA: universal stress protein [Gaiellaceae bacterium]|jgi:nucleotide-binding universal stress UspA family protein